ncbi:MAG: hypothetical protein PHD14_03580 [Dehalococcoidales bacterium]|jgi:hypothetical protein|nr:hypothetical protein [Dehalococcoidales bacterium]NLT28183.1 hypothetical protein [Dehalococcoidales bacterium]
MSLRNKQYLYVLGIIAGIALVIAGAFFKDAEIKGLMGICIGVGAGLIGMFVANLIILRIETKHPQAFVQKKIEEKDERNRMIWDKTRAKANTIIMMAVMPILTLVFVLIDAELYVILAMVGLILLNAGLYIGYSNYYNNRL